MLAVSVRNGRKLVGHWEVFIGIGIRLVWALMPFICRPAHQLEGGLQRSGRSIGTE